MNERIRTWLCPICNRRAEFKDLFIDTYFQKILSQLSGESDISEVEIQPSGEWSIVQIKKETSKESKENNSKLAGRETPSQTRTNARLSSISSNDVNQQINTESQPSTALNSNINNDNNDNSTTPLTRVAKNLCTLADTASRYAISLREMTNRIFSINNNNNLTNKNESNTLWPYHQFNSHHNRNSHHQDERGTSVDNAIVLDSDSE
jgi:hypothetical protein